MKIDHGGYTVFFKTFLHQNWQRRLRHVFSKPVRKLIMKVTTCFSRLFFAFGVVTLGRGLPAAVALFQLTCKNGSRSFSKKTHSKYLEYHGFYLKTL